MLTHFRETRNSIIPPNKSLISSGMNVLKKKEEFKRVLQDIEGTYDDSSARPVNQP